MAHRHDSGCGAAIYLAAPRRRHARALLDAAGRADACLPHHAPTRGISLADYYTLRDQAGRVLYRPTAHYAYHPCDDAVLSLHEFAGRNWDLQPAGA